VRRVITAGGQLSHYSKTTNDSTREHWHAQADDEARFVRQLDRLDMALQARWYAARDGLGVEWTQDGKVAQAGLWKDGGLAN
jgi:hypothetical protein